MRQWACLALLSVLAGTAPHAQEWSSFRGAGGAGTSAGANPPRSWNLETSTNVRWQTSIPGMGHSSPVVWGNRVFVTSAVPGGGASLTFRHGAGILEGSAAATKDAVTHSWRVYALDCSTGAIAWERVAREGMPRTARHVKASQANATPVTDGKHLVVFFGSEGLYCYDLEGKLLWQRDLGPLASGFFWDPTYEWNTASSPVIYRNRVFLQVDMMKDSFLAAFDLDTGQELWRVKRDALPSWGTPLVYEGTRRIELVAPGAPFVRGYDPETGRELWKLGGHSDVTVPMPVAGPDVIFVSSGQTPIQPIYAVRPGATGDITLADSESSNASVAWSKRRGGPYTPTPILYDGLFYVCSSNGVLAAYRPGTGERVYQERIGGQGGAYTASIVAAAGRLYFASEDGQVFVVKAGPKYELISANEMGEVVMATPAIANDMLIVRTQHRVVALGEPAKPTQ